MAVKSDGFRRTRSVLCGERMERQEAARFGGVRMVGSCFISNPALASITKRMPVPLNGSRLLDVQASRLQTQSELTLVTASGDSCRANDAVDDRGAQSALV